MGDLIENLRVVDMSRQLISDFVFAIASIKKGEENATWCCFSLFGEIHIVKKIWLKQKFLFSKVF